MSCCSFSDYSCALQKEILVHGRLYVSQNYLCFYANIFGWETNVTVRWKDVSAITKEKTALVIPNAILICTRSDRFFLTSFVARDKTYLMLFRIWQNALMDQPMTQQEMWQWVWYELKTFEDILLKYISFIYFFFLFHTPSAASFVRYSFLLNTLTKLKWVFFAA